VVRYWDLAATEKTEFNDPDWTVGIKLGRDRNGGYWLLDMVRRRANPGDVETLLRSTAAQDGTQVRIGFGQDPGQAGKSQVLYLTRALSGFMVDQNQESGDKRTRAVQFAVPRRECKDLERPLERRLVPNPRRLSGSPP
jgi:phage terminase large subunit-like protein